MVTNLKCSTATTTQAFNQPVPLKQYHHPRNKIILKQESVESSQISCCRLNNSLKAHEGNSSSSCYNTLSSKNFQNGEFSNEKTNVEKTLRGSNKSATSSRRLNAPEDSCKNTYILRS